MCFSLPLLPFLSPSFSRLSLSLSPSPFPPSLSLFDVESVLLVLLLSIWHASTSVYARTLLSSLCVCVFKDPCKCSQAKTNLCVSTHAIEVRRVEYWKSLFSAVKVGSFRVLLPQANVSYSRKQSYM